MVVPKIYNLEDLVLCVQQSLKSVLPRCTTNARGNIENFVRSFTSNAAAEYKFENAYFDVPACPFHEVSSPGAQEGVKYWRGTHLAGPKVC